MESMGVSSRRRAWRVWNATTLENADAKRARFFFREASSSSTDASSSSSSSFFVSAIPRANAKSPALLFVFCLTPSASSTKRSAGTANRVVSRAATKTTARSGSAANASSGAPKNEPARSVAAFGPRGVSSASVRRFTFENALCQFSREEDREEAVPGTSPGTSPGKGTHASPGTETCTSTAPSATTYHASSRRKGNAASRVSEVVCFFFAFASFALACFARRSAWWNVPADVFPAAEFARDSRSSRGKCVITRSPARTSTRHIASQTALRSPALKSAKYRT